MCVYMYDKECCACIWLREVVGSPSLEILKTGLAKALSTLDLLCGGGWPGTTGGPFQPKLFYESRSVPFHEIKSMKNVF